MTNKDKYNSKNKKSNKVVNNNVINNTPAMKILTVAGVIILFTVLVLLMHYFFVVKNDLQINMSTDKKLEFIKINDKDELISTQKYVSDLGYTMRYDVKNFTVFKYKKQDIYKYVNEERILIVVEEGEIPSNCTETSLNNVYKNCIVMPDNYTKEYYITIAGRTYKITVKTPNLTFDEKGLTERIEYMLNSFEIK